MLDMPQCAELVDARTPMANHLAPPASSALYITELTVARCRVLALLPSILPDVFGREDHINHKSEAINYQFAQYYSMRTGHSERGQLMRAFI
ncbi:hypothetical protein [Acuticoccus yangtzensis]|uniref:hypothetical protein n=1 Tax=Acuticoccus yangtzensis TaxID=1443441 RepID=UPI0011152405|nr:hypothetical protein [Acuticoccus yangtzensis]